MAGVVVRVEADEVRLQHRAQHLLQEDRATGSLDCILLLVQVVRPQCRSAVMALIDL